MKKHLAVSRKEVLDLLQRKRRHGRSLTGVELASLLDRALREDIETMSSEALLSTSACLGASLSIEDENRVGYIKARGCER